MLPKSQRLTRSFEIVFRKGAKLSSPFFILRAVPAWDEVSRLAITVSKKTEKTAVKRNRIRRRLIAAVKKADFPKNPEKSFRIVLIGRSEVLSAEYVQLVKSIQETFTRLEGWRFPAPKKT